MLARVAKPLPGPSHRPEPWSVRDLQPAQVRKPEPLVQRRTALSAGFEVRGYALSVAAIERGTQQRRTKAATLEARGHTQIANVVVRLLKVIRLEEPLQASRAEQPHTKSA